MLAIADWTALDVDAGEIGTAPVLRELSRYLSTETMVCKVTFVGRLERLVSSPILVPEGSEFSPHYGRTRLLDVVPILVDRINTLTPHLITGATSFMEDEHVVDVPEQPTHDLGSAFVLRSLR
jgi:hypothetical protein